MSGLLGPGSIPVSRPQELAIERPGIFVGGGKTREFLASLARSTPGLTRQGPYVLDPREQALYWWDGQDWTPIAWFNGDAEMSNGLAREEYNVFAAGARGGGAGGGGGVTPAQKPGDPPLMQPVTFAFRQFGVSVAGTSGSLAVGAPITIASATITGFPAGGLGILEFPLSIISNDRTMRIRLLADSVIAFEQTLTPFLGVLFTSLSVGPSSGDIRASALAGRTTLSLTLETLSGPDTTDWAFAGGVASGLILSAWGA